MFLGSIVTVEKSNARMITNPVAFLWKLLCSLNSIPYMVGADKDTEYETGETVPQLRALAAF